MSDRMRYTATETDESYYWERVRRNLGWLGNTEEEQRERQLKLRNAKIGIAGVGGIGGATAERLVRMGVQNLKVADPDTFEKSNINRQFGATFGNVGRNKAEAVAELVYETTRDVNIEVFPEGITEESVDEFFEDCDYVLDKIELYEISARYTLHRAFRRSTQCQFMMCTPVFGHRTFFFKWTRDSMPAEEYFGVPEGEEMNEKNARQLISRFIPEMPDYPGPEILEEWFIKNQECPIFAGTPPLAQGMLASRIGMAITGLDQLPGSVQLPVTPGYAMLDTQKWVAKTVEGKWWE
ncbi:ThiF family adenylyltransferase [Streptomyces violens]|uniref:ThiF family adenylyltransferase n=1 Tax=Streptomyces violens TaxID=66377 RepID=UPI0004C0C7D1|nr:ThiF family adenylyltransferase [Streptomyces violens]